MNLSLRPCWLARTDLGVYWGSTKQDKTHNFVDSPDGMFNKVSRKEDYPFITSPPRIKDEGVGIGGICLRSTPNRGLQLFCTFILSFLLLWVVFGVAVLAAIDLADDLPVTMRYSAFLSLLAGLVSAHPQEVSYQDGQSVPLGPDEDGKYTISSEGIRAQFIPYGASLTNLFITDVNGIERDIVLGYDNATAYAKDASHPHLGGVPGKSIHCTTQVNAVCSTLRDLYIEVGDLTNGCRSVRQKD
jgi:hypothetical protein